MKVLYLDESGSSDFTEKTQNLFVLGGVVVDSENLRRNQRLIDDFKIKHLGTTDAVLHWSEISNQRNKFGFLRNPELRKGFNDDMNALMEKLQFTVIACVIDKKMWQKKYKDHAVDPYAYSIKILVDRIISLSSFAEKISIETEMRGKKQDRQIQLAFDAMRNLGTEFNTANKIKCKIAKMTGHKKSENIAGLQLADLVLTPIKRRLEKRKTGDYSPSCDIIYGKCIKNKRGDIMGAGIICLPNK